MSVPMPRTPQDLNVAFLTELVGESRPGVTVTGARIGKISQFGEINVSTSDNQARDSVGGVAFATPGGCRSLERRDKPPWLQSGHAPMVEFCFRSAFYCF